MKILGFDLHFNPAPMALAPHWALELYALGHTILDNMENRMATADQIKALSSGVAALITEGLADIQKAVTAAQAGNTAADPAIDQLISDVQGGLQKFKDAVAGLTSPAAPQPDPNAQSAQPQPQTGAAQTAQDPAAPGQAQPEVQHQQ